jgi:hypothetical protein
VRSSARRVRRRTIFFGLTVSGCHQPCGKVNSVVDTSSFSTVNNSAVRRSGHKNHEGTRAVTQPSVPEAYLVSGCSLALGLGNVEWFAWCAEGQ